MPAHGPDFIVAWTDRQTAPDEANPRSPRLCRGIGGALLPRRGVDSLPIEESSNRVHLRVKVVPGASRTKLAGLLGDRLKITVATPPEGGRANREVCRLLAARFGVANRQVRVVSGQSQPLKTIELDGVSASDAAQRLSALLRG